LDRTFAALADPGRRRLLDRVAQRPTSITDLAGFLDVSVPAALKQVRALEAAELVVTRKVGRTRWCELGPGRLDEAEQWMHDHRRRWERRLDRFEQHLEATKEKR
jgi:DNA-binding transcriptional ArsR family regulator